MFIIEVLDFKYIYKRKIWGGDISTSRYISSEFSNEESERIGEVLILSNLKDEQNVIKNGKYKGQTVESIWNEHSELFGESKYETFPVLMKLINAKDHLSIQLHPEKNDSINISKSECWYVIDCSEDAEIILGHNARSKEELNQYIKNCDWDSLVKKRFIKPGDFIYVPGGTIHAIMEGTVILEISEPADITYRLYDYNRIYPDGNSRTLHIDQALHFINTPEDINSNSYYQINCEENLRIISYLKNECFNIEKWENRKSSEIPVHWNFAVAYCLSGNGFINGKELEQGNAYLFTCNNDKLIMEGIFSVIICKY